jgi:hypothetical protein
MCYLDPDISCTPKAPTPIHALAQVINGLRAIRRLALARTYRFLWDSRAKRTVPAPTFNP